MREKFNKLIKGEAYKMRDIAVGPTIALMTIPAVLVVVVAGIMIFAIVKIIRISKSKKSGFDSVFNAAGSAAPAGDAAKKEE